MLQPHSERAGLRFLLIDRLCFCELKGFQALSPVSFCFAFSGEICSNDAVEW